MQRVFATYKYHANFDRQCDVLDALMHEQRIACSVCLAILNYFDDYIDDYIQLLQLYTIAKW